MKLKELHIRNIASIERADIDFEHDLNDAVTGSPASIFLISGDTGAGKSVILDSISMALYKKTPRIADVANATRNDYTDAEGEQIRVASIEQYTRLGIADKDESYSEVAFEGNDGRTYHARLTLGMKLGAKDKETGIRPLKHRKPVWEIRIGNSDWTRDSVEQTILDAVGLDFQQFGRMAMLAQGQFANFLTGDKKEREAILEQLTNTQHFTAYGEAITSLWKKAKDHQAQLQTRYDTEKPHTLSDEEVGQLTKEQQEYQQQFDVLDERLKKFEQYIEKVRRTCELANSLKAEQARSAGLLEAKAAATQAARKAEDDVKVKDAEIEALSRQRKALNPQTIDDEKSKKEAAKRELENIRRASDESEIALKETAALRTEIANETSRLAALKETSEREEQVFLAMKSEYEKADKRLTTMQMSVKDTLVNLRHRLQEQHADTCPLCGQHIDHDHLDDDFSGILTPLEAEQERAAEAYRQATLRRDAARDAYKNFDGAHQNKRRQLETADKKMAKAKETLETKAKAAGLDVSEPLVPQTEKQISILNDDIARLRADQQKAEALQMQINALLEAKRPLDKRRSEAERAKTIAENMAASNAEAIIKMAKDHQTLTDECERLKAEIESRQEDNAQQFCRWDNLEEARAATSRQRDDVLSKMAQTKSRLDTHRANILRLKEIERQLEDSTQRFRRWDKLNRIFGGTRFRTLVQTYILRPLLNNANIYLEQITDRYHLTCSEDNEQLSILVHDRYNKNQVRSVTVLSGGERFMLSLALSLALSSLNRPDMNVNILFIDEGFGTLDEKSLDSVMSTLEKLQEIAGQTNRRVGIISHREELDERIPVKIQVLKKGEGRSLIAVSNENHLGEMCS